MNLLKLIKKLGIGIIHSSRRFPYTLISSTIVAILLIIISQWFVDIKADTREFLNKTTMIFSLGLPISLCARVYYERKKEVSLSKLNFYYFVTALIQILYYFFFLKDINPISITRFI